MSAYRIALQALAVCSFLVLTAVYASAHAAIVWAYAEGNTVFVEAFFANGTKIQGAKVLILDQNKNRLLEGKTNKEGKFSYTPVTKKPQTVVVGSGESHIGDFELTEEDLKEIQIPKKNTPPAQAGGVKVE